LCDESYSDVVGLDGATVTDEMEHEGEDETIETPERDCRDAVAVGEKKKSALATLRDEVEDGH
jgi:hypothetical protein